MGVPAIAIAATVVSSVIQAKAAQQQASAQASALNYQGALARQNAGIAEQYAQMETQRGEVMAQQKQQQTASRVGSIRAATGAAGLDTAGTPDRLEADTLSMGDLDARTIRYNAAKAAYGYRVQGSSYSAQAKLDDMGADDALSGGKLAMLGSIIGGGSSVADKWSMYQTKGVSGF